jgi:hypothetical protein
MTLKNAIRIGKSLGTLLEVDNRDNLGLICRQYLRLRVELNTNRSLGARFLSFQAGQRTTLGKFQYERLADYCTLCGLIGHKKFSCPAPPMHPPANYGMSLTAASPSYPRVHPENHPAAVGAIGMSSSLPLLHSAGSSQGTESAHLQLVTRSINPSTLVPIQPSVPYAITAPLDEGHVGSFSHPLCISGSSSRVDSTARGVSPVLESKLTAAEKGKSPLPYEKSSSLNIPDHAYPFHHDFDKPAAFDHPDTTKSPTTQSPVIAYLL